MEPPLLLSKPKPKTWLWVLLGVLVFALLAVSLLVYYGAPPPGETSQIQELKNMAAVENALKALELDALESGLADIENELE
jgi:PDZ domain-containing secreted protein